MQKTMMKVAALAIAFLFFHVSNAKAQNDFNLNSITVSDIEFSEEFGNGGIFNFIRRDENVLKPKIEKEWTIMIFKNAKNNLERYGLKNVNEMEMIGSSDKVNIVVELGRMEGYDSFEGDWIGSRRYLILKDNNTDAVTSPIVQDLGKVDMGDWKHLVDFGKWAKANYPAKKYMLIVWNHGTGWIKHIKPLKNKGISYDEETDNHFTTPQLGMALNEIGKLDVYASDACLMQMTSIDYEIKDNITYIVGSEGPEPGDGYTYNTMIEMIVSNPEIMAYQAAKVLVDSYSNQYQDFNFAYTQSFIKTSTLPKFRILMNDWISAITKAGDKKTVKSAVLNTQNYTMKDNKDLYHFVSIIGDKTNNAAVKEKSEVLMNYIKENMVAYNRWNSSVSGWWSPKDYSNSHGIAVYLPEDSYDNDYDDLKWAKDSNWDEFIKWYLAK